MASVRAIHIQHWADTLPAQGELPALIRRLIRNTVAVDSVVNFPAFEQTHRPGFDGIVSVSVGNQYVPSGSSVWEMGVDEDKLAKANRDFDLRTKKTATEIQKATTYVAVTPREWQKKNEWRSGQLEIGSWKDIIVLDCNDLEQWIELSTATDYWLSAIMGHASKGVTDISHRWTSLENIAPVPLLPQIFLASREKQRTALIEWLRRPASSLLLKSRSFEIGIDFITALVEACGDEITESMPFLLVTDPDAWRELTLAHDRFVLVPSDDLILDASDIAGALNTGHHVVVCAGSSSAVNPQNPLQLPELDSYNLCDELISCGLPEAKAKSDSRACCGSTTVLKRLITDKSMTAFPEWSRPEHSSLLAPFALFGAWVHVERDERQTQQRLLPDNTPIDVFFLREFLQRSPQSIDGMIARWSLGPDALFRWFGSHVVICSREDAWHLLGGQLSPEHLKRFEDVACLILSEDDPGYELAPDQRWLASIYGKVIPLSTELRTAIVESLALMTTFKTSIAPSSGVNFEATCQRVIDQVLPRGASWKRWASLGQNLMLLAEADPDLYLSRVEQDLSSSVPEIPKLFENNEPSLFGRSDHTSILWSLETLSWSPTYLGRALAALCRIGDVVSGGRHGNRPDNSAEAILFLNHSADSSHRLSAIRTMIDAAPTTAWKVLAHVLSPSNSEIYMMPHLPRWRSWANQHVDREGYAAGLYKATVELAGDSLLRWSHVVDGLLRFNKVRTCEHLELLTRDVQPSTAGSFELWNKLRTLTHRLRIHKGSKWADTFEPIEKIEVFRDRLEPMDPVQRHHWLFSRDIRIPGLTDENFEVRQSAIRERRLRALNEIVNDSQFDGVKRLIRLCEWSQSVGPIIGEQNLLSWAEIEAPETFNSENEFFGFARGYANARFWKEEWDCIKDTRLDAWTASQLVNLILVFPVRRDVWDWATSLSNEVANGYWDRFDCDYVQLDASDLHYAVDRLLERNRPLMALSLLNSQEKEESQTDYQLVATLLLEGAHSTEQVNQHFQYAIEKMIEALQEQKDFPLAAMASIEWAYLSIIDREVSPLRPKSLEGAVCNDPHFFVMVIEALYARDMGTDTNPTSSELKRAKAKHAKLLLDNVETLPGRFDELQATDYEFTRKWIDKVRSLVTGKERSECADFEIGRLLHNAPTDEHGMPVSDVVKILENVPGDALRRGFLNALMNSRGATFRSHQDGGKEEHELAARYRKTSQHFAATYPLVSEMFAKISRSYDTEARQEDLEAERRRLGR